MTAANQHEAIVGGGRALLHCVQPTSCPQCSIWPIFASRIIHCVIYLWTESNLKLFPWTPFKSNQARRPATRGYDICVAVYNKDVKCVYTSSRTQWFTAFAVLPLPILVCGTVCRCSFENQAFHSTVLNPCWRRFCFRWRRSGALRLIVKSTVYKYVYLLTYLLNCCRPKTPMDATDWFRRIYLHSNRSTLHIYQQ